MALFLVAIGGLKTIFQFFDATLKELLPFPFPKHLAVAVSGGADSLCLAFLLSLWAPSQGVKVFALTVDHRLRPTSSEEAAYVADLTRSWGLSHATLSLSTPPQKRLQEGARKQRYDELILFCHDHDIPCLLLAHHQDDQLETFLMRLQEGSGPLGLGGMLPTTSLLGVQLYRPFLSTPKIFLQHFLEVHGIGWREDPSNQNLRFLRVRTRKLLTALPKTERQFWMQQCVKFHQKKWADGVICRDLLSYICTWTKEAKALLDLKHWAEIPLPLQEILLEKILRKVGGVSAHPLSLCSKRQLLEKLKDRWPSALTLGGCVLRPQGQRILISREWQRIKPISLRGCENSLLWDGRFYIRFLEGCSLEGKQLLPQGRALSLGKDFGDQMASFPAIWGGETSPFSFSPPFDSLRWL